MWIRVQINNQKHDFHFQLVWQTLSKAFCRVDADQGGSNMEMLEEGGGRGQKHRQCDPRRPAATHFKE